MTKHDIKQFLIAFGAAFREKESGAVEAFELLDHVITSPVDDVDLERASEKIVEVVDFGDVRSEHDRTKAQIEEAQQALATIVGECANEAEMVMVADRLLEKWAEAGMEKMGFQRAELPLIVENGPDGKAWCKRCHSRDYPLVNHKCEPKGP